MRGLSGLLREVALRTTPKTALTADEVFDVLGSDRRRWIIEHLTGIDEPTTKRELSEAIAFIEDPEVERIADISTRARRASFVALHQTHLPVLEEHGIIEWDHFVKPTEEADALVEIIREVRRRSA